MRRALGAALTHPIVFGVLYLGVLVFPVRRITIAMGAVTVSFGALLGLAASLLLRLRGRAMGTGFSSGLHGALVVVALHFALTWVAMAEAPQLYATHWYAAGGVRRTVQVLATDVLGTRGALAASCMLVIAFVVGPWRADTRAWLRTRSGGVTASVLMGAAVLIGTLLGRGERPSAGSKYLALAPLPPLQPVKKMNILWIAVDSLRADRVPSAVAPRLSALAQRGEQYEHAYVSIPRTFPSWVTWLTGRHAHHHGIRSMFPRAEERAANFDALPSRLVQAGYQTAVISDYAGDIFARVGLGFERTLVPTTNFRELIRQRAFANETPLLPLLHTRAGRRLLPVLREFNQAADPRMLTQDAVNALDQMRASDKPFFATVFYSTAHFPYAAPAPYYGRFTDKSYRGRYKYHRPVGLGREEAATEADKRQIRGLYDGAVASVDEAIGTLLDALTERGLAESTLVVVSADHGESLFEEGRAPGHGDHLYGDESTHVPLIIAGPGVAPRRVSGIVRDVDLAPTLYERMMVKGPDDMDGKPIAYAPVGQFAYAETELWFTEHAMESGSRIMYPGVAGITELDDRDDIVLQRRVLELTTVARHRMVRDERWKLVYVPTRQAVRYMLFDTRSDPGEVHDVAATFPAELERMKAELWRWMLADPRMVKYGDYVVPREGLGREVVAPRPAPLERKRSNERDELVMRLVDAVGTAKFSLGDRDRDHVRDAVSAYPRKFRSPWHGGRDADLVQIFSIHTPGAASAHKGSRGKGASLWMAEEGTLEQRESIVAPAPSELRIPVLLPRGARLEVSLAVLEAAGTATQFSVSVVANGKPAEQVWALRIGPPQARHWQQRVIDLSAHGGEKVELVLATAHSVLQPGEESDEPLPPPDSRSPEGEQAGQVKLPIAVWGDPVLLAPRETQVPANVVFIVVDALRADAIASLHREDSLLPKVPGLTPAIDQLVTEGVGFRRAYSVATWTRPGTLALLSGKRSSELGVDPSSWVVPVAEAARFYRSEPPLLTLLLRSRGVRSRAFVNNFFMLGHTDVGLDMAFDALDDFRYGTADTDAITKAALGYLDAHRRERFFLFLNYNSPHAPYSAPAECLARVPKREQRNDKGGEQVRAYMAEACKDDVGIGHVLKKIDDLGLRDETLVVLSADHGETLSSAHAQLGLDGVPLRFHHATSNFEETIHIPIVLRYPPRLPKGKLIDVRVRSTDIVPTVLDLFDLPQAPMSGRSLLPVVVGVEREDRAVVSEGRGHRALLSGTFHYLQYDRPPAVTTPPPGPLLFDLSADPGERRNVITERPDIAARMRDQLLTGAGQEAPPSASEPRFAFRFSGAGKVKRVRASIRFEKPPALVPVGITMEELRADGTQVEVALSTVPGAVVGFDAIGVQNSIQWQFYFDEVRVDGHELGGPHGLPLRLARGGARSRAAFSEIAASAITLIDPMVDDGVFVALLGRESLEETRGTGAEMQRALEDWGYATKKPGGLR